jgi:hypothetical protein
MRKFWGVLIFLSLFTIQESWVQEPSTGPADPLDWITSDWWRVAGNPDLGELSTNEQQPVDFAIWQAKDGTWQLWSCIRKTNCGGKTRLLHRWQGRHLTDTHWKPMGIAMQADPNFGETPGGLQAPFVMNWMGEYIMWYGDWQNICKAKSYDGKTFAKMLAKDGKTGLFSEGPDANARDAMVLQIGGMFYCYYTAHPNQQGAVYARASHDLNTWTDSYKVAYGGVAGTKFWHAECPHVVEKNGMYYLFRTQSYAPHPKTTVYRSTNHLDFGVDDDQYRIGTLPVAAPEIILHEGEYYIAALTPDLDGIRVAKFSIPN